MFDKNNSWSKFIKLCKFHIQIFPYNVIISTKLIGHQIDCLCMIVHRISFHKNRFYAVRDNSRRAIAGSLLGANPVFAASSSFGANICETIAKDLTIAPLTLNVGYVRLGNVAILSGLSS